jgi:hypothetical protein
MNRLLLVLIIVVAVWIDRQLEKAFSRLKDTLTRMEGKIDAISLPKGGQ